MRVVLLGILGAVVLAAPVWAQYDPANPEATDPHHIYVHPGEPGYNPNWPNDMPTPDPTGDFASHGKILHPITDAQQAELDSVAELTGSDDFSADLIERLKHLNLTLVKAGPELHKGHAVILVGVEQKVSPRIQEQFDEEMQGIGQGYPVLLEHEDPIKIEEAIQFLKKPAGPAPEEEGRPGQ